MVTGVAGGDHRSGGGRRSTSATAKRGRGRGQGGRGGAPTHPGGDGDDGTGRADGDAAVLDARRPAREDEDAAVDFRRPRTDYLRGMEELDGAELGAVLSSSGTAGVDGDRDGSGGGRTGSSARLGLGVPRERRGSRGGSTRGGASTYCQGRGGPDAGKVRWSTRRQRHGASARAAQ